VSGRWRRIAGRLRALVERARPRPVEHLDDLVEGARVSFSGLAVADPPLVEPVEGMACLAATLRAWPPATTVGVDGASARASRAFEARAEAFAPFNVELLGQTVRVVPRRGGDLAAMFAQMTKAHGLDLRCEVVALPAVCKVYLEGVVRCGPSVVGSPHRRGCAELVVELHTLRGRQPPMVLPHPASRVERGA